MNKRFNITPNSYSFYERWRVESEYMLKMQGKPQLSTSAFNRTSSAQPAPCQAQTESKLNFIVANDGRRFLEFRRP